MTRIVENCVYYSLYLKLSEIPLERHIEILQDTSVLLLAEVQPFVNNYIWQKDPFQLKITKNETHPSYLYLSGQTCFGDCVDDEWLIVFLLRFITTKFTDIVVRVFDNDGEFLLIEAAMQLPAWLDPDTSENRVYIHKGTLHIIPFDKTVTSIEQGVDIVRSNLFVTEADPQVQEVAFVKVNEYPQKTIANVHRTRCHIPRSIAHILYHKPQLVAAAVEAFYTRDPIAMKACHKMEKFSPSTSITVTVKMTKTLYAQMVSQRFHPPKPFKLPSSTSKEYAEAELGMKLACGFEILSTDVYYANLSKSKVDTTESYLFNTDDSWLAFKDRLTRRDYFRGEVEGSNLYDELEKIAKQQYLKNRNNPISSKTEFENESSPLDQIDGLLKLPMIPDEVLTANKINDDDSWMNIDPKDLEDLLQSKSVPKQESTTKAADGNDHVDLNKVLEEFESFVEFENAGIEGAEFIDEYSPDDEEEDEDEDEEVSDIKFNPTKFLDIVRRTLDMTTEQDAEFDSYMQAMDAELASTKIGKSFVRSLGERTDQQTPVAKENANTRDGDVDDPVDIDLNAVTNLLASFKAQEGLPGPAGNIMGRLGVQVLPRDADSDDESDSEIK